MHIMYGFFMIRLNVSAIMLKYVCKQKRKGEIYGEKHTDCSDRKRLLY